MKMHELFARINKGDQNHTDPDIDDWANAFDISVPWDSDAQDQLEKRLSGYWAVKWYCTDTWVGTILYFLDGEPLGISSQGGRKCGVEVSFVSEEMAEKLRQVLIELCVPNKPNGVSLINMDEEVGESYTIGYGSQLLTKEGLYNGEPATVVKTFERYDEIDKWTTLVVNTEHGEQTINMDEFLIPYPIEEQQ